MSENAWLQPLPERDKAVIGADRKEDDNDNDAENDPAGRHEAKLLVGKRAIPERGGTTGGSRPRIGSCLGRKQGRISSSLPSSRDPYSAAVIASKIGRRRPLVNAEQAVHPRHGDRIVRDDDEARLGRGRHLVQQGAEAFDVVVVERRVDLVQHADR